MNHMKQHIIVFSVLWKQNRVNTLIFNDKTNIFTNQYVHLPAYVHCRISDGSFWRYSNTVLSVYTLLSPWKGGMNHKAVERLCIGSS